MDKLNAYSGNLTQLFLRIAELGGALVLALLAIYLLLGDTAGPYVVSVANNVADFIARVTPGRRLGASHYFGAAASDKKIRRR
jgi:hypothetical protein